jgi:lipopolysaccharide transport system permease protein
MRNSRDHQAQTELVIEAGGHASRYWGDLWRYRELFYFLAWRDVLVRYKQTVIGVAWNLIRPLLAMVVFTVVFGKLAKLPSEGIPYPLYVYAAMLPWQFFANSVSESSMSLVTNANLISKVYFPRLIIPASSIMVNLIDFLMSFVVLMALMFWYQCVPGWRIVTLPAFVVLSFAASFGIGVWITSLNVRYRDFRYVVPFVVQLGLFISPVGFSSAIVPDKWRFLYCLNPMVGIIDGFRWAILGTGISTYGPGLMLSLGVVVLSVVTGLWYFRKTERTFSDVI